MVSTYHFACNPLNVGASFRNAGISAGVDDNRKHITYLQVENCCCLLLPFPMSDLEEFDDSLHISLELDEVIESADLVSLPFWRQVLEEEASSFRE
jgi:hypothetical protein